MTLFSLLLITGCDDDPVNPQIPIPTVTGIAPNVGMVGTEVTISGSNFSPVANENTVAFNGVQTAVKSASASQLVVDVPQGATSGPVTVRVDGQTATGPTFTILEDGPSLCDMSDITEDTIWEDRVPGDAVDYVVECDISIQNNAVLTIEPGVVIAFEGTLSGIFTSEGGGLRAVGTSADPIVFKGTSDNKGVWKGIYFGSDNPQNRLEHVVVMHAGRSASSVSGEVGAVQLSRKNESEGEIVSCTITNNDGYGLFVNDGTQLKEFSNNTITDNSDAPAALFFNQLGALGSDSDLSGDVNNYIEVRENEIEDEAVVISDLGIPYRFVDGRKYDITNDLEISAGAELQFIGGSGLRLGSPGSDCGERTGSLNATGTASILATF